jgi:hypothetical protein
MQCMYSHRTSPMGVGYGGFTGWERNLPPRFICTDPCRLQNPELIRVIWKAALGAPQLGTLAA